jgi:hypothetical protein
MTTTSTNDVRPRAQTALTSSPICELRDLEVEQREGILVICGTVSSFYHKQLAQEVVRSVCRDTEIVNAIRVEWVDWSGHNSFSAVAEPRREPPQSWDMGQEHGGS